MNPVSNTSPVSGSLYPTSSPAVTAPPVDTSSALGGMVQDSVTLSSESGIVATLEGGTSSYSASDLLNSMMNAGPQGTSSSPSDQTTQQSSSTQTGNSTTSGIYDASGALQSLPGDINSNWASVLKGNPSLTNVVAQDTVDQGIVGTL